MERYKGVTVCEGVAIGPAYVMRANKEKARFTEDDDDAVMSAPGRVQTELLRLERALEKTRVRMDKMVLDAGVKAGKDAAQIFLMHQLVLEGNEFRNLSRICIEEGHMDAIDAVTHTGEALASKFAEMEDDYMAARADDVRDIAREIITVLEEGDDEPITDEEPAVKDDYPYILVAGSLLPSDVIELERDRVQAIVTVNGSPTSHASILANMMDIPMVVSVPLNLEAIEDGTPIYVNADTGEIIIQPDVDFTEEAKKSTDPSKYELQRAIGMETKTRGGKHIDLYANIASVVDLKMALKNDAEGIGLYRSEFIFLDRPEPPSEDEQYSVYKKMLTVCKGKPLTIRTMDLGGDKRVSYLEMGDKRGLAFSLEHQELFRTQLRALIRASIHGELKIMYPYVTSAEEVMQANSLFGEVKWSMLSEVGSTNIPQGIMVETVKAVEQIDRLVDHAEFISIGTNDLTCDLYGIDRYERANPSIDDDYAKLFMTIRNVVRTAHKAGLKVSICGELAARRDYASRFLDTGADCISIAPSKVLLMRDHIINCCW